MLSLAVFPIWRGILNILICTQLRDEYDFLQKSFSDALSRNGLESVILKFSAIEDMLDFLSVSPDAPDIVVLCIRELYDEKKEKIRELSYKYKNTRLILVSCEPQSAEELFSLNLSYFFRYPISKDSFRQFCRCLEQRWLEKNTKFFSWETKKTNVKISYSDILYVTSDKRQAIFYLSGGKTNTIYSKLDQIEQMLDGRFIRCHQSFLVNASYIRGIGEDGFTMVDKIFIPISQKKYWASKKRYINYIKEQG